MTNASELFHAGQLQDAIAAQIAKVKSSPTDQPARFFLFELFLFSGDLDRARKQLDVLKYDDPKHSAAVAQYRFALEAEAKRREVFAGIGEPKGLTAVVEHIPLRLEGLARLARGDHAEARKKFDEANAITPTLTGAINGQPFEGLIDADERFGTIIEVFGAGGVYSWVPLEAIQSITLNPPAAPRDIILRPAQIVLTDGMQGDVFLPGLYPNTFAQPDQELTLGRATDWTGEDDAISCGIGGRIYQNGAGTLFPMLNLLQIIRPDAAEDTPSDAPAD